MSLLFPTKFLRERKNESLLTEGIAVDDIREKRVALIILNSPVSDFEYFRRLYNHASFRVCADGGANRVHDMLVKNHKTLKWTEALQIAPPDVVHGDLDSLDHMVRERYEQIGVEVSQDLDQYSTDFAKAVEKAVERLPEVRDVLVLGSIGGRVDQGIGLLHELYREQKLKHPGVRFWLFSETSISTILQPGSVAISTPLAEGLIERNMGILPLYGPAVISTEGLEWDVQDWPTEMGGQVSTSNHIVSERIRISTDHHVLFTIERTTTS